MTAYVTSSENLVPAASGSPRLLRLENSLIERVIGQQYHHVLNIQNIISLNLLGGKFENVNSIFRHLSGDNVTSGTSGETGSANGTSNQLVILSLNRLLETELFPVENDSEKLVQVARQRVELHFNNMTADSDFGLEAK